MFQGSVSDTEVRTDTTTRPKQDETVTLSKSARKRLARQTAKAAAAPPILSPGNNDEVYKSVADKGKTNGERSRTNGNNTGSASASVSSVESSKAPAEEIKDTIKENVVEAKAKVEDKAKEVKKAVDSGVETISSATKGPVPEPTSPTPADKSAAKSTPIDIKQAASPVTQTSAQSPPKSSSFSPSLPSSLPEPSSNQLPSNRKRKAPQDFTPSGPGTPTGGPSPAKNGVKFEDGVAPGQGPEGERTIPKKKNQNVIERTVWTFIMIFGFIGLLCAGHPYMILLVMVCQTLVYKEVTTLFDLRDRKFHRF